MLRDFAKEAEDERRKAAEARRERALENAREDLRKQLDAALTDLHEEAHKNPIREKLSGH
jgi:F0F1-type ATP synthase membrane subunit b/b'